MKRFLLLFLIVFPLVCSAQYVDYNGVVWKMTINGQDATYDAVGCQLKTDSLLIEIRPSLMSSFQSCTIHNWSGDEMRIKWNDARVHHNKLLLGDMRRFEIHNPIPDDCVYDQDFAIKDIGYDGTIISIEEVRKLFKKNKETVKIYWDIILPIEIHGKKNVYRFEFVGEYSGKPKR